MLTEAEAACGFTAGRGLERPDERRYGKTTDGGQDVSAIEIQGAGLTWGSNAAVDEPSRCEITAQL